MKNFLKNSISAVILLLLLPKLGSSQCFSPSINAQAGTGPSTTICSGQCASLTATVVPPPNSTTSYSFSSPSYSTHAYTGGSNVFATSSDDLWSDSISIGFNFCYFGQSYRKLLVGSNGEITFDLTKANTPESWVCTQVLPNLVEHPGNTICGAYRDYDPFPGGVVRTYTMGVAPCRVFVAYWSGVTLFSCSTPVSSFQIALYETTNQIAVNIVNSTACMTWNNGRGLIGIQNGSGTAVVAPPSRNTLTAWTATTESWRFVPTGASSYSVTWAGPGGFSATGFTAAPCPTTTSTYSATMTYCGGTRTSTVQVNVSTPTVVASASSNTVCAPGSVTLTGSGATSYTWMPGSMTGSTVVVSPTINTTYTLFGMTGSCTGSTTIGITVGTPPTVNAFNLSGTICPGGSANGVATGALTYTWNPGGIIGNIVSLSPTVTTTYTVLGSSGGCVGTTTVVIPVGSSPTITAVSSPTAICPGQSATLTASGALSYTWNPGGAMTSSIVVNPTITTTYSITGTSTLACPGTQTVTLVVSPIPTVIATASPATICAGSSSTLTASGALTYTWNPGGSTGTPITVTPTASTVYTVVGTNAGGCTGTRTVNITVNPSPTVTASAATTLICSGNSTTLTAAGATTYTWNPGGITSNPATVSPTSNTTYTVTGSNGTCSSTAVISVSVNPSPTVTASSSPTAFCSGNSATLTASGASTYTWSPGSLNGAVITVTPGSTTTYSAAGTNTAGCSRTGTVLVTVNITPTVNASSSSTAICSGQTATLTGSGATTYTWNPGGLTGTSVTVSPASNTTYTVTGSNGACSSTRTIALVVNPNPTVNATSSPTAICSGGSATLTGSGATTYSWNPGALTGTSVVVSPATSTTYTMTGANGFGCTATRTVALVVNASPTINATASPTAICIVGSVTLSATGATSYTWNPGGTTGSSVVVNPTVTSTYSVTGTNAAGCTNTRTLSVVVNSSPTITATSSPTVICAGASATLTSSGATTYSWSPGALTGSNVVVSPSVTTVYTVTGITGACSSTQTVSLLVNANPTVNAAASPTAICVVGSSTLTATGATSYTWNPGAMTGSNVVVTPVSTTNYTVTGVNAAGCTNTRTLTVTVNSIPTVTASSSPTAICAGQTATLNAGGALTYTWNPGTLTGSAVAVSPTTTTNYTVIGATGACTNIAFVTLLVNPSPTITASASPTAICSGASATLTGSGATSYTWNPGALSGATVAASPTISTTYTLTGTSAGCSSTRTVALIVNPNPTVTASSTPTSICSSSGVSATLTGSGATSYSWNPGSLTGTSVTVMPASTTIYTVTGASAAGCTGNGTVMVTVIPTPTVTASVSPTAICVGSSATLTSTGATTYSWNPGALTGSNVVVSPTVTTIYTVTGANGACVNTRTVSLTVNSNPTVTATASPTSICSGASSTLTANGAVSYTWNPGAVTGTSISVTPSITTTYTVTGATAAGCTNTSTLTLTVTTTPTISASVSPTAICAGNSATLSATGATTYTWNPGSLTGSNVAVSPTITTIYTVTGANGLCTNTRTVSLTVNANPTVSAVTSPTAICVGATATLTGSGAITYSWNPGALTGTSVVVSPSINTTYTVTGLNASGCSNSNTVSLVVNANPTVNATASPTAICVVGSSTLTATGASSYTWNPGAMTGSNVIVTPVSTTNYTVTGVNAAGCTNTRTITVTVNSIPTVTASSTPTAICSGQTATLNAGGAVTYTWSPGSLTGSNVAVTPTTTTNYTVIGATGACTNIAFVTLIVNPTPTVTASASPTAICSGASTTLTGNGAASYTWNPGALTGTSVSVTPSITTTYSLIGSNAFGCTNNATVTVSITPTPTLNPIVTPTAICAGASATLSTTGATSYTWNPPAVTGSSVVVSPTVTTTYTVFGLNGSCSSSATVSLIVNPNPTVTAVASPTAICTGASSTLTASGATSYTWNPGAMTGTSIVVSPTINTTYSITGANGLCTSTSTLLLVVNSNPTITASAFKPTICLGDSTTLSANGASTYTWVPAGTGVSANLSFVTPTVTTIYTVTGTTAAGCTGTATVSVVVNTFPTVTATSSPTAICVGGTATLTGNGASSYTWNPGAMTGTSVVVSPTTTTIYTITGANGSCASNGTYTLTVNPNPTVTASSSPTVICAGSSATLTGSGATSYTWNPGGSTGTSVVVSPTLNTTYTVTGSNGNCTNTNTVSIVVNASPTVNATSSSTAICAGGSATLTASGATSYTWMPVALTGTSIAVTPTATTIYTVFGTNGTCIGTRTISIVVNSNPTVTASSTPTAICVGSSATLTGSGATTYSWSPGSLTGTSVVVSPTVTTTYTVTGANGSCTNTNTISLTVNANPTITAAGSPASICRGSSSTLTANGASSYTWNPGALTGTSVVVSPTVSTQYTVVGSNIAGCTSTRTLNIVVLPTPSVNAISNPTAICSGASATLVAFGAPQYTWNPGGMTGSPVVVTPTATTIYTVIGRNGLGCTNTRTVSVTVNSTPTVVAAGSPTLLCSGSSSTLTATGATTYTWNPGGLPNPTVVVTPTSSTIYTVTGANGTCVNTRTVGILVINVPTLTASGNPTMICNGSSSTLTAGGAVSYTWNPGSISGNTTVVTPTITTTYTVTGANGAGCTSTRTITINVNTPTISVAASNPSLCLSGSSTLTASGANSYTWNPGASTGTSVVVSPTITTTYTVVGTNTMGCSGTNTISIVVNTIPTITAVSNPTLICSGNSATLTGSGATSYTWNPGSMTGTAVVVTPTVNTTYTVTGESGACSNTETVTVAVANGPTITALSSPTAICSGSSSTLTASGALSYTWNPGAATGSVTVVSPTVTTTYTFTGDNAAGCTSSDTITVYVNTPTITASATPTSICMVGSVTLSATGAASYTWNPGAVAGSTTVVTPTVTSTYTVDGINSFGCTSSTTISVVVNFNPTVTVAASSNTLCSGYTATLTANGATTYTWMPSSLTGGTVSVTPTVSTIYTVTGENGSCAPDTKTISITVIPAPANVTANNTGTLTCLNPTVGLLGASTSTGIAYVWTGPASYTSSLQNPTGITSGGVYTLSVIDLANGCVSTATTDVIDLKAGPSASITTSGSITCISNTIGITASSTVATASFTWTGPSSFSTTAMSFTASTAGTYTLTGFDPGTGCTSTNTLAVINFTSVPITASIVPATCTGSLSNNNGTIILFNFGPADKFDFVAGSTYTGSATYASAIVIPAGGQITNSIANPTVTTPYTVRMFGSNGCFKDTTLMLTPVDCSMNNALGIAKAVGSPTLQSNGSYNVTYTVVVKNSGAANLNNVSLTENLSTTFPAPTTFSLVSAPMVTSAGSSLSIDPAFNGSTVTVMTNSLTSQLAAGKADTIVFTVNVVTNGVFGSFNNSVLGAAIGGTLNTVVGDSSEVGLIPDPDNDGNPTNNNVPTPLNFNPNLFFGLTKQAELSEKLSDNTYDITYTITVHNLGNDTLFNVTVKDSLYGTTIKQPASYTLKSGPFTTGTFSANTAYNGNTDVNLLVSSSSKIAPGNTHTIIFTINVNPDTVTVISNIATGSALSSASVAVSDTSNTGNNPDTNGNGVWNETADNMPTVVTLPDTELFIPGGFSPNGDGKNDFFVIKGLDKTIENKLIIFNRWGNKVYQMDNYDNTWDGTPNTGGTLGNQKLPQGTYYYILEFKNSDLEPVNGYVILQY